MVFQSFNLWSHMTPTLTTPASGVSSRLMQRSSVLLPEPLAPRIEITSSGSGKSTLLRCINLLETPDAGVVSVGGETIEMTAGPSYATTG
jgi:ABC-type histidine transport system ATPase subunit